MMPLPYCSSLIVVHLNGADLLPLHTHSHVFMHSSASRLWPVGGTSAVTCPVAASPTLGITAVSRWLYLTGWLVDALMCR